MSRVALGANISMSQRQKQQLIEDQQEELVASSHTRSGGTDYASGNFSRVRDRMAIQQNVEASRPRTPDEISDDMHQQWAASVEANRQALEQARVVAQQKRDVEAKAVADAAAARKAAAVAKQRHAVAEFNENLVLHEISDLTPEENQNFWEKFAAYDPSNVGAANIIAESIRLNRKD